MFQGKHVLPSIVWLTLPVYFSPDLRHSSLLDLSTLSYTSRQTFILPLGNLIVWSICLKKNEIDIFFLIFCSEEFLFYLIKADPFLLRVCHNIMFLILSLNKAIQYNMTLTFLYDINAKYPTKKRKLIFIITKLFFAFKKKWF